MTVLCLLAAGTELRAGMADPAAWLQASEARRLAAFGAPARQQSFLAGRWLARQAVQRWLGTDRLPALEVAESGACHVANAGGVSVSISHSGDHIACAVAGVAVGVDVETLGRPRDHLGLARVVLGQAEQDQLAQLGPQARASAFLKAWTLREAWLKARELGLDFALMRGLTFHDDPSGDAAVGDVGECVLALAADPGLPAVIEGPPGVDWQRCRTRQVPAA